MTGGVDDEDVFVNRDPEEGPLNDQLQPYRLVERQVWFGWIFFGLHFPASVVYSSTAQIFTFIQSASSGSVSSKVRHLLIIFIMARCCRCFEIVKLLCSEVLTD